MKGIAQAIPTYLYVLVALVVGVMMLIMISRYSPVFFGDEKNVNAGGSKEKVSKTLAKIIEDCWEDHRRGLDDKSEVCKEITFETILKIDEKELNDHLNCEKLPNSDCYPDECSDCSSDYFDDTDKILWLAEPENTELEVSYDSNLRKIIVTGSSCDDLCVCKRDCKKKYIETGSNYEDCIAGCENLFDCDLTWGDCTRTELDFVNYQCDVSLDCSLCTSGRPTMLSSTATDTDWCEYCKESLETGYCSDGIDNDCDGKVDSKTVNPDNFDDDCPTCGGVGNAFLHGDMWPWWHNFRVQCDPEFKKLWLCEKMNSLGLQTSTCNNERTAANSCDLSATPNWAVCCPDRISGCSHRGDDLCDATAFDYDTLFNSYYGWQWDSHTDWHKRNQLIIKQGGTIIATFTETTDSPYRGTGQGYIMKFGSNSQVEYDKPFGTFGCIEIPANGVAVDITVEWMDPVFAHTCPYAGGLGCTKSTSFVPEPGKHYIWEYTDEIREVDESICDIPPHIKQRLNNAGIPVDSCSTSN